MGMIICLLFVYLIKQCVGSHESIGSMEHKPIFETSNQLNHIRSLFLMAMRSTEWCESSDINEPNPFIERSANNNQSNTETVSPTNINNEPIYQSFVTLYENGISAYLSNDWDECINQLEQSLTGYRNYYHTITSCRIECEYKRQREKPFYESDIEHLHFYELAIKKTLCMRQCKDTLLPHLPAYFYLDKWSRNVFAECKPYEYLHLCYYKKNELQKAASAAYTILLKTLNNTMMVNNLKFYIENIDNFRSDLLEDFEEKRFAKFYLDGLDKYANDDWPNVIELMEKSLQQFLYDWDECRAFCEGEFDQGWHSDMISSTANHFTYSLRCKRNCTTELSYIRGVFYEHILANHFDYLQIAYFHENNIREACRAAASYQYILPNSMDMIDNIEYYRKRDEFKQSFLTPRNEAKRFHLIHEYEHRILQFVDEQFQEKV